MAVESLEPSPLIYQPPIKPSRLHDHPHPVCPRNGTRPLRSSRRRDCSGGFAARSRAKESSRCLRCMWPTNLLNSWAFDPDVPLPNEVRRGLQCRRCGIGTKSDSLNFNVIAAWTWKHSTRRSSMSGRWRLVLALFLGEMNYFRRLGQCQAVREWFPSGA